MMTLPTASIIGMSTLSLLILALFIAPSQEGLVPPATTSVTSDKKDAHPTATQSGSLRWYLGLIGVIWYLVVLLLGYTGWVEIMRKFSQRKKLPKPNWKCEPVSIIRPCKGIDTEMLQCLESCILQEYPKDKFEVLFCVENTTDLCIPIIKQLIEKYPDYDLKLLISSAVDEKPIDYFGPNPKINNLAKAYRHAAYDIVWVLDSNVWVSPGTLARSVRSLEESLDNGLPTHGRPVVLTHHVPLAISISDRKSLSLSARLDEMFLFSSHAKFYVAFNKASIAPCVNGKSNLYRRSSLDEAVALIGTGEKSTDLFRDKEIQSGARIIELKNQNKVPHEHASFLEVTSSDGQLQERTIECTRHFHGIEFFSTYIGEDNMIGTALWDMLGGRTGMTGDVVVQPLKFGTRDDGLRNYINRRVRWLRVRKYMVLAATLLEPTTESIVIGLMGSFGVSALIGGRMSIVFSCHMILWCLTDWLQYKVLMDNLYQDECLHDLPQFLKEHGHRRPLCDWLKIWLLRELCALPIWVEAMCGSVIYWRNKPFKIKRDLTAEALNIM